MAAIASSLSLLTNYFPLDKNEKFYQKKEDIQLKFKEVIQNTIESICEPFASFSDSFGEPVSEIKLR